MKDTTITNVLLFILLINDANSFVSHFHRRLQRTSTYLQDSSSPSSSINPRDERRRILKSDNYNRMGFKEEKQEVEKIMLEQFSSPLLSELRSNGRITTRGDVTVSLAEQYGFCWGVERAIAMAYEARSHFPEQNIYLTNEIIHNPEVNKKLKDLDIKIMEKGEGGKDFNAISNGDVVILPAFGGTIQELQLLDQKGVQIVDTTCPWVSKVWNAVDSHRKAGQTSVIHGKYSHEETIATASFCEDYIIIKDLEEANYLAKYIAEGGDKDEFMKKFGKAVSKGFDPEKHLKKIGLANQTTMYKSETKEIGRILEIAMLKKFGPQNLSDHYKEFDTICDATQERQDAVMTLVNQRDLDFILVVGGFDSSNTAHLKEIPEKFGINSFHIDCAERIGADNTIQHRTLTGEIVKVSNFLKPGKLKIGVTSGASTPDRSVEDALERIFMIHKLLENK